MASYYSYLRCLLVALAFLVTMGRGQQSSPPSPPAPTVKFKDLEAIVNSKTRYNVLPFDVQVDFVKITVNAVLVPITIQIPNRAMTFVSKDGVARATVNIFGRVTTPTGKIVETFEETQRLDVPDELLSKVINNVALFQKALPLRPATYRFDVVIKDVNGNKLGTFGQGITVPQYSDDKLASSSLILADVVEPAPPREVGTGDFVIGATKVRPRVRPSDGKLPTFKRDQKINFWMQVYNLRVGPKTGQPSATIEYRVLRTSNGEMVVDITESAQNMHSGADQITLTKSLQGNKLEPGLYEVTIKINDLLSQQTISPTAKFAVE